MRAFLSLVVLGTILLIAGCSNDATPPAPVESPAPTEGQTPAEVTDLMSANTPGNLEAAPEGSDQWPAWPPADVVKNSDVYAVTILWGQLQNSLTPGMPVTDWTGRLWVNGVSVVQARRTIAFEPVQDSLVPENIDSEVAWVSETSVDFDGISFLVWLRRDITYIMAPTLHFETAPFSVEYTFEEIKRLDKFYVLPAGNAVAVHARQIWPHRCNGGFIEGQWIKNDNAGASGRIDGLWLDYRGVPFGSMTGLFWTNPDGSREFSGTVSGVFLTVVIAEFRGTWWYDDPRMCPLCGSGHGWFRGSFTYANGSNKGGQLLGEFGDFQSPDVSVLQLPIVGVWSEFCVWTPENTGSSNTSD